jgi:hypothetical protein
LEESEEIEFKLSRLKMVVESMKDEFKQELYALKYDLYSIKVDILNKIMVPHILKKKMRRIRTLSPSHI